MPRLPDCTAHGPSCPRDAFLLLRDEPVCRAGYEEKGGVL